MPLTLKAEDIAFLERVWALGDAGLTQDEIAARLDLNPSTFRFRLRDLGFTFQRRNQLRARPHLGGRSFVDMRAAGEILLAESAEAVPA